jgi:hypothetical protein
MDINVAFEVAGSVLALVAILAAYFFGRRGKQRPDLRFVMDFDLLLDLRDHALRLRFEDSSISQVSRTFLALWNRRGDTIRHRDVVSGDPVRLQLEDGDTPLQARVVFRSRPQIALAPRIIGNAVAVDFDFLDSGDGGVIEVLHRGVGCPRMLGTVRGSQLKGRMDGRLAPADIRWMSARSWSARVRSYVASIGAARLVSLGMMMLLTGVFTMTGVVALVLGLRAEPRLVFSAHYHLTTLSGQNQFAQAVTNRGVQSGLNLAAVVVFLVLGTAYFGLLMAELRRHPIPRSIVAEELRSEAASWTSAR